MHTQRIAITLLLSVLILLSCQTKRSNTLSKNEEPSIVKSETANLPPEIGLNLPEYTNGFTESITQQFVVVPKKITVITAKQGLKVTVDPAVLEKEDGSPVDGKIKVNIVELTNSNDLFKANAATMSDGKLLASGGSYFIGMECNGEKLIVKNGETIEVSFPMLKRDEMELFYGERNEKNDMNWKKAAVLLEPQKESISFTDSNPFEVNNGIPDSLSEMLPFRVYRTLNEPVYYYKKRMTLGELVDTLNHKNPKVYLQTISYWPKNLPRDKYIDSNYLTMAYGPRLQYILKTCSYIEEETKELQRRKRIRDSLIKKWQPKSLAGQLQKYYAPASIRSLGWINCDRYYRNDQQSEVALEFPITLNNSTMQYFIIYKSFNGLTNSRIVLGEDSKAVIRNLPIGESVTLIAFTKSQGNIYQCKEDFIIEKNNKIELSLTVISEEELKKIFSGNVRI